MRVLVPLVIGWFLCINSYAQQQECEVMFNRVIAKTKEQRNAAKSGFEFDCRLKIIKSSSEVSEDKMRIVQYGGKYFFESKSTAIYQDQANFVAIQDDPKVVYITIPQSIQQQEKQFTQLFSMMDSLQKYIQFQGCSREFGSVNKSEGYRKIVFAPSLELKATGIRLISYWISEQDLTVRKILLEYDQENDYHLKSYELIIDKLSYAYKGNVFTGNAIQKIYKEDKVIPDYVGYRIVDTRKNK